MIKENTRLCQDPSGSAYLFATQFYVLVASSRQLQSYPLSLPPRQSPDPVQTFNKGKGPLVVRTSCRQPLVFLVPGQSIFLPVATFRSQCASPGPRILLCHLGRNFPRMERFFIPVQRLCFPCFRSYVRHLVAVCPSTIQRQKRIKTIPLFPFLPLGNTGSTSKDKPSSCSLLGTVKLKTKDFHLTFLPDLTRGDSNQLPFPKPCHSSQ